MATTFLCVILSAICDKRNGIPLTAQPIVCVLLVMSLCLFYSANAGAEVNPARDIGPKIMALCVGYGWEVIRCIIYIKTVIIRSDSCYHYQPWNHKNPT